ncbi:Pyridoxal dependent decarboxylase conserved domain [Trypanosoma vivax]|nr:Pyridoxal dependent decarboxylase conserved domain [Trypanosoma vivax]
MLRFCALRCCAFEKLVRYSSNFLNELMEAEKRVCAPPDALNCHIPPLPTRSAAPAALASKPVSTEWLGALLKNADTARCLQRAPADSSELRASLIIALMKGAQKSNSIINTMDGHSVSMLEKSVVDAVAALLGLPQRFMWCHANRGECSQSEDYCGVTEDTHSFQCGSRVSATLDRGLVALGSKYRDFTGGGGGVLHSSSLESLIVLLTAARAEAYARYISVQFSSPDDEARVAQRLAIYCTDQCQPLLTQAARCVGIRHVRTLQTVYSPTVHNYPMPVDMLKMALAEDVSHGLYPLMVCGVFGSSVVGAVDPLEELADLCSKLKLWFHIDASHSGLVLMTSPTREVSFEDRARVDIDGSAVPATVVPLDEVWARHTMSFSRAALQANSIHINLSTSFAPVLLSTSPASLLYFASVAKVSAALECVKNGNEARANVWCTPKLTAAAQDTARLRLEPPNAHSAELIRLAFVLQQEDESQLMRVVQAQQAAMAYLQQRLRADGQFDCSIHAACFGMVVFRWLTRADEETEALMWCWKKKLSSRTTEHTMEGRKVLTFSSRITLGLVRVQRRLHICVGLSDGIGGDGDRDAVLKQGDVDLLVETLKDAVILMESERSI